MATGATAEPLGPHLAAAGLTESARWMHDPSRIVRRADRRDVVIATGRAQEDGYACGLEMWSRAPGGAWEPATCLFTDKPDWIADELPDNQGALWAPDLLGPDLMLYSASDGFDGATSCVGLAVRDSASWRDLGGPVTCSVREAWAGFGREIAAIDPTLARDGDGFVIALGGGVIQAARVETVGALHDLDWLDAASADWTQLAAGPLEGGEPGWVEAAFLHQHDGWWWLFANHGSCCRGVDSTYVIVVGRSRDPLGPFLDRDGAPMLDGGGTPLLDDHGARIGPGHPAISDAGAMSYHYYDAERDGAAWIGEARLDWTEGWPRVVEIVR